MTLLVGLSFIGLLLLLIDAAIGRVEAAVAVRCRRRQLRRADTYRTELGVARPPTTHAAAPTPCRVLGCTQPTALTWDRRIPLCPDHTSAVAWATGLAQACAVGDHHTEHLYRDLLADTELRLHHTRTTQAVHNLDGGERPPVTAVDPTRRANP